MKKCPECNGKGIIFELEYVKTEPDNPCSIDMKITDTKIPKKVCKLCNGEGQLDNEFYGLVMSDQENNYIEINPIKVILITIIITLAISAIVFVSIN